MTRMRNGCLVSPARLVYQRSLSANVTRALEGEAVTKLQNESPTVPLVFGVDKKASFWLQLFSNHCYVCFWACCELFYCDWKHAPTQICKIFADNKDTTSSTNHKTFSHNMKSTLTSDRHPCCGGKVWMISVWISVWIHFTTSDDLDKHKQQRLTLSKNIGDGVFGENFTQQLNSTVKNDF